MRSYEIEIKPGVGQKVHRSQLKPFRHESMDGPKFPLHYFRLTPAEEVGHEDEWQVERILKRSILKQVERSRGLVSWFLPMRHGR